MRRPTKETWISQIGSCSGELLPSSFVDLRGYHTDGKMMKFDWRWRILLWIVARWIRVEMVTIIGHGGGYRRVLRKVATSRGTQGKLSHRKGYDET